MRIPVMRIARPMKTKSPTITGRLLDESFMLLNKIVIVKTLNPVILAVKDIVKLSDLHELAIQEHRHAVTGCLRTSQVMRNDDRTGVVALTHFVNQFVYLCTGDWVEPGCWF